MCDHAAETIMSFQVAHHKTAAMEKYLQTFPEDDFMRKMLAIAREP